MDLQQLTTYLALFSNARIGVMGDYCVDAYWTLDEGEREISIETGKPTHAVCVDKGGSSARCGFGIGCKHV